MQQGDAIQIADTVMSAFLMMMSSNDKSSEVQEDALMAVGQYLIAELISLHWAVIYQLFCYKVLTIC